MLARKDVILDISERQISGSDGDSVSAQATPQEAAVDPVSDGRATEKADQSASEQAATPGVRWMDVDYGGVSFLVGSYRARNVDGGSEKQSNTELKVLAAEQSRLDEPAALGSKTTGPVRVTPPASHTGAVAGGSIAALAASVIGALSSGWSSRCLCRRTPPWQSCRQV
jgi:hypothetical protein